MYDFRTWFQHGTALLFLLLTIPTTPTHAQNSNNNNSNQNIVSIFSDSALASLRPCASTCMEGESIAEWLRCRTPLMNECFCRRGLTSIGRASLFDCAKAGCNGDYEIDGMALTSVYTSYCNEYLAQFQTTTTGSPASNSARTTSGAEAGGDRTTLQTSRQSSSTIPTNTSAAASSSAGLSTGARIGVGVGVSVLVLVAIGVGVGIWWYKQGRRRNADPGLPSGGSANEAFIGAYPKSGVISAVSSVEIGGTPLRELEGRPIPPRELEGVTPPLTPKVSRSFH